MFHETGSEPLAGEADGSTRESGDVCPIALFIVERLVSSLVKNPKDSPWPTGEQFGRDNKTRVIARTREDNQKIKVLRYANGLNVSNQDGRVCRANVVGDLSRRSKFWHVLHSTERFVPPNLYST